MFSARGTRTPVEDDELLLNHLTRPVSFWISPLSRLHNICDMRGKHFLLPLRRPMRRVKRLPHGAYFPFGDGPRICIGNHFATMETVLVLATIGQHYRTTLVSDHPLTLVPSVTLRPKHGVTLMIHKRPWKDASSVDTQAA